MVSGTYLPNRWEQPSRFFHYQHCENVFRNWYDPPWSWTGPKIDMTAPRINHGLSGTLNSSFLILVRLSPFKSTDRSLGRNMIIGENEPGTRRYTFWSRSDFGGGSHVIIKFFESHFCSSFIFSNWTKSGPNRLTVDHKRNSITWSFQEKFLLTKRET